MFSNKMVARYLTIWLHILSCHAMTRIPSRHILLDVCTQALFSRLNSNHAKEILYLSMNKSHAIAFFVNSKLCVKNSCHVTTKHNGREVMIFLLFVFMLVCKKISEYVCAFSYIYQPCFIWSPLQKVISFRNM